MSSLRCSVGRGRDGSLLDLLIATNNHGKLAELFELLSDTPFRLLSLSDVGIDFEVPETGSTFEKNAEIKATAYLERSGLLTLADDSGLEVRALGGEPGVYSSRYAGEGATDAQRIALLLQNLDNIPEGRRQARFRCAIALAPPRGPAELFTGECPGTITRSPRGDNGFGYDPVFLLDGSDRTMAELSRDEKGRISHRSRTLRKVIPELERMAA